MTGDLPEPPPGQSGWPWIGDSSPPPETVLEGSPWPKISVVTPSFNQGPFIEATIRSALLQGYPNLELIIIDGGSTDGTLEVIRKYEPWLAYWVSEPDRGQGQAVNKGIRKATGEILHWLNSDDLLLPGSFQLAARVFHAHPETRILCGQARIIDANGSICGELRSEYHTWEELATNPRNSVRQVSTFFDTWLFEELGFINENLHIALDSDWMARATQFNKPLILKEYLTAYRAHPGAKTSNQLIRGYRETDSVRLPLLPADSYRAKYRQRSALNWISLFESNRFSRKERLVCLLDAFKIWPAILRHRRFWSAIKSHLR